MQVAERAVLRSAARGAAELPRARQRGHARRHPARRAALPAARPAVGRAGRQRRGVRVAAARRRLRHVRDRRARRSRSDGGQLQARRGRRRRPEAGGSGGPVGREGSRRSASRLAYQQAPLASRPCAGAASRGDARRRWRCSIASIAAKGGLETLRALKTIVARQTQVEPAPPTARVDGRDDQLPRVPGSRPSSRDAGRWCRRTTARTSWVKDARGVHDAPDAFVREMAAGLRRDIVSLLLAAHGGRADARACCPTSKDADGRVSHALELSAHRPRTRSCSTSIRRSGLIAKQTYAADAPGPAARRGAVLRLPRRRRRPVRLPRDADRSGRCRSSGA